jgi:gas vesicle protein
MGAIRRIGAFLFGGMLGAGVGAAVAMLAAPQSGDDFTASVERRIDHVKVAGL